MRNLAILRCWPAAVLGLIAAATAAREPVIDEPCEGCETVFVGMPAQIEASARIAPAGEPGVPLVLTGTARTAGGMPAPDIIVYAYHTDAHGVYPKADTRHGRLRGWVRTDADGRYRFDTIRPGAYPGRSVPEHIHMHVIEPGRGTYYIDDVTFDDDPLLTPAHRRRTEGRGGEGLGHPQRDAEGRWQLRRDIVLGAGLASD